MKHPAIKAFQAKYASAKRDKCKENNCRFTAGKTPKTVQTLIFSGDHIIREGKSCDCLVLQCDQAANTFRAILAELKDEKVRDLKPIIEKFQNSTNHKDIRELLSASQDIALFLVSRGLNSLTLKKYRSKLKIATPKGARAIELKKCNA